MVSTGVDVVAKTDDEVYVLSIIKIYSYFSFVFSIRLKKDRVLGTIESDLATLKIFTTMLKW